MALVKAAAVRYNQKVRLSGDRPAPLMIQNESKKIQKNKKPVIIYVVSPKVIHVEARGFMALVQQLTGYSSATNIGSSGSEVSSTEDAGVGNRHSFPVKVKARVLKREGTERDKLLSILPSVFSRDSKDQKSDVPQEVDFMDSENWFKWGDYD